MKKTRIATLLAVMGLMSLALVSCSEKESTARVPLNTLLGNWVYYVMTNPLEPEPGMTLSIRKERNIAIVDGQEMRWKYEGDKFTARRQEGNVIYWLQLQVMGYNEADGLLSVNGAHGFCENVSGTEWDTDRMAGHSWALEQPGFFARM